jgi:hypothetical protein
MKGLYKMYNAIELTKMREVKVELFVALTLNAMLPAMFNHFVCVGNKTEYKFSTSEAYTAEDIAEEVCSKIKRLGYVCKWDEKERAYFVALPAVTT